MIEYAGQIEEKETIHFKGTVRKQRDQAARARSAPG